MNKQTICLVTGASSGIGRAIAKYLAEDPSNQVIATARRKERLQELERENLEAVAGDLNDVEFQDALIDQVYAKYERCDYLFNSAGMVEVGTIEEMNVEITRTVMMIVLFIVASGSYSHGNDSVLMKIAESSM
jgi:NADP-dependent 3-hydroxy acid dehydrogenase YdfG